MPSQQMTEPTDDESKSYSSENFDADHTEPLIMVTTREAVLHAASLQGNIAVLGKIVYVEFQTKRVDIAHEGAKLIVDCCNVDVDCDQFSIGDDIRVVGKLKRHQRRLYFEAADITKM